MAAKIFFIVLLTICAFQKFQSSPVAKTIDQKSIFGDIIEEALRLAQATIKYIAEVIREVVDQARQTVEDILKTILEIGKQLQEEAQETLKRLLDSVVDEIEKAKENALQAGVDIAECIAGQEEAAKQVIEEVTREIATCVSDKVSEGEQKSRELLELIIAAVRIPDDASENITQCFQLSGPFVVLDCVIRETSGATEEAFHIATVIRKKIIEAETFLQLAVPDVALCAGSKLLRAQQKVSEIIKDIAICVDAKLHPNTSAHKTQ